MTNGLLGLIPIEAYINKSKLQFMGRLCNMPCDKACKKIFLTRLFTYKLCDVNQQGSIPDMLHFTDKYGLHEYLTSFIKTGAFPENKIWKRIVHNAVVKVEECEWKKRINQDFEFERFKRIHTNLRLSRWHKIARKYIDSKKYVQVVLKMITTSIPGDLNFNCCPKCGGLFLDIVQHLIVGCLFLQDTINEMWDKIIDTFPVEFSVRLHQLDDDAFILAVLGADFQHDLESCEYEQFLLLCAKYVYYMVEKYEVFHIFSQPL
jgi:hypothetical protein